MESLVARSAGVGISHATLPSGEVVPVRTLQVTFGRATPDRLKAGVLPPSYTSRPLVSVGGDAMFGELAVVRTLEKDGWEAVWVDTTHGRKFWRAMPHRSAPVTLPPAARARYEAIVEANGGRASGFFDVLAWRDGQFAHLEYVAEGERPGRSAARWVAAALAAGVTAPELWFVLHPGARDDGVDDATHAPVG